jgi:hypothetical protein
VHLLFRQSSKGGGNVLIRDFFRLFDRKAHDHFRQDRRRGNSAGTAETLEFRFFDPFVFIQFECKAERVATVGTDLTNTVRFSTSPTLRGFQKCS